MKNLELNIKHVAEFVTKSQIDAFDSAAANGLEQLEKGTGAGNDFLGWMHLPSDCLLDTSPSPRHCS